MDAIKCLKERRSVRSYVKKDIPKEVLKEIIDCARLAPTARNTQPWQFVVVTNCDLLNRIAEIATHGKFIKDASACILVFCTDYDYYLEDGCAATQNIMLAAYANEIGSCWVAGDKKDYAKEIASLVSATPDLNLVSIIPLGYAKDFPDPYNKKNIDSVLKWDNF